MWDKLKNITPGTWARTVCLLLAFVNQILAIFGKEALPVLENDVYQLVTIVATLVTGIIAWWKNNSFTKSAQISDEIMKTLKDGEHAE